MIKESVMGVRSVVCTLVASGLIATANLSAQTAGSAAPAAQAPGKPPAPGASPARPPAPPAVPERRTDPSDGGQLVNVRLDISITDQTGPGAVQPKVLTLLLADRSLSQVRSSFEDRAIKVDARPTIMDGRIRLTLTMESQRSTANGPATLVWNQGFTVLVENAKPLVVVENSDVATNRKLTIEVKATILK
jgi:hypothetical protein